MNKLFKDSMSLISLGNDIDDINLVLKTKIDDVFVEKTLANKRDRLQREYDRRYKDFKVLQTKEAIKKYRI